METFQEWFNNNNISDLFTPSVEDSEDALIALACEKQWDDIALILREVFKLPPVKAVFFKSYLIKRTQKNDDKHEEKDPNDDKLSSKSLATNSNTNVSHGNTDILNAINTNTNVSLATNSNTNVSHGNTDIDEKKKNKMTTQQAMDRSKKGQTNKENWERPCWSERKQLPFVHLVMVHATFLLSFIHSDCDSQLNNFTFDAFKLWCETNEIKPEEQDGGQCYDCSGSSKYANLSFVLSKGISLKHNRSRILAHYEKHHPKVMTDMDTEEGPIHPSHKELAWEHIFLGYKIPIQITEIAPESRTVWSLEHQKTLAQDPLIKYLNELIMGGKVTHTKLTQQREKQEQTKARKDEAKQSKQKQKQKPPPSPSNISTVAPSEISIVAPSAKPTPPPPVISSRNRKRKRSVTPQSSDDEIAGASVDSDEENIEPESDEDYKPPKKKHKSDKKRTDKAKKKRKDKDKKTRRRRQGTGPKQYDGCSGAGDITECTFILMNKRLSSYPGCKSDKCFNGTCRSKLNKGHKHFRCANCQNIICKVCGASL
eukprot:807117_1